MNLKTTFWRLVMGAIMAVTAIMTLPTATKTLISISMSMSVLTMLIVGCAFVAITMGIVSFLFEGRLFPFGKNSAMALIPGDGFLIMLILGLAAKANAEEIGDTVSWCLPIAIGISVFFTLRKREAHYYNRGMYAPSKKWHDIYGYFLFTTMITRLSIPLSWSKLLSLTTVVGLTAYVLCLQYDGGFDPEKVAPIRHPSRWQSLPEHIRIRGWRTVKDMASAFCAANQVDGRKPKPTQKSPE